MKAQIGQILVTAAGGAIAAAIGWNAAVNANSSATNEAQKQQIVGFLAQLRAADKCLGAAMVSGMAEKGCTTDTFSAPMAVAYPESANLLSKYRELFSTAGSAISECYTKRSELGPIKTMDELRELSDCSRKIVSSAERFKVLGELEGFLLEKATELQKR